MAALPTKRRAVAQKPPTLSANIASIGEQSLDRLDAYLKNLQSVETKSSGKKK